MLGMVKYVFIAPSPRQLSSKRCDATKKKTGRPCMQNTLMSAGVARTPRLPIPSEASTRHPGWTAEYITRCGDLPKTFDFSQAEQAEAMRPAASPPNFAVFGARRAFGKGKAQGSFRQCSLPSAAEQFRQ